MNIRQLNTNIPIYFLELCKKPTHVYWIEICIPVNAQCISKWEGLSLEYLRAGSFPWISISSMPMQFKDTTGRKLFLSLYFYFSVHAIIQHSYNWGHKFHRLPWFLFCKFSGKNCWNCHSVIRTACTVLSPSWIHCGP